MTTKLPAPFVERMQQLLGVEYAPFEAALAAETPSSIRINKGKIAVNDLDSFDGVPWCEEGYYLPHRYNYTFDPLFHAGTYYVQEASSMYMWQAIKQYVKKPVRYLDLCAAPGGKSTLALSALPEGSLVVCNEVMRNRAHILAENVMKWGNPYAIVTNNDSAAFTPLRHYFDVIATDVPCSGEGMFRKDEGAIEEWSEANVTLCANRQREILDNIWEALCPNGILIYSTCTYNTQENEEMVTYLVERYGATPLPIERNEAWGVREGIMGSNPVNRFMPHLTKGEGLFLAILRKPNNEPNERDITLRNATKKEKKGKGKPSNKRESGTPPTLPKDISSWITHSNDYQIAIEQDKVVAFPSPYADDLALFARHNIIYKGITLGEAKGKEVVPHHALALSTAIHKGHFATVEVDLLTAIAYLRREAITLSPETPRGIALVCYKGYPLGWIKNIGNRANNLYPQEWRIRSGHLPDILNSPIRI